jgi:hypothetical protein
MRELNNSTAIKLRLTLTCSRLKAASEVGEAGSVGLREGY